MKSSWFCTGSAAAVIMALGVATPSWAQDQPPVEDSTDVEELTITGSLIRGTPLDAALPVEVYTTVELEKQGVPTALEFAKSLTIAGPTTGEAYYFGGAPPGSVAYNLRGIGADKTLTLLNGRRVSENASNIPFIALARTEVLKDGAAVTYGADAVGGVVNFITRRNFVGLELSGQYKYIDGSDGDYSLGLLGGIGEGDTNFLFAAEWEHRSRLNTLERDWTYDSFDYTVPGYNPAPWSTLTNLAGWTPRGALPASPSVANEFGAVLAAPIPDYTLGPAGTCAAVGGRPDSTFACAYNYIPYYNLVEENDIYRAYAQLNTKLTENLDAHAEVAVGVVSSPQIFGSPAQPVITGPAMATGLVNQFYIPIANPHAAAFAARTGAPASTQGFTPTTYRAFAHGGNPFLGEGNGFGVPSNYYSQIYRVSGDLTWRPGDFMFLEDIRANVALTYNNAKVEFDSPDGLGFRLQQALYGFGGPGCTAPDLDPNRFGTQNAALAGVGACSFWNPFATNFAGQPNRNLTNPQYVATSANSEELSRWLFDPRATELLTNDITFDAVIDGYAFELPGGPVGWAVGFQRRQQESREFVGSDFYNGGQPCPWPNGTTSQNGVGSPPLENNPIATTDPAFRGCTPDGPGPFTFFGINRPDNLDQHQHSFFGELDIPLLDTLNLQAAVRHEQFSGDLSATVYKVAGKWDVWGPLSLRGSYGTNYVAPPLNVTPGEINNAVRSYSIAANNWLGAQFITDASLQPETATTWNLGVILQGQGVRPDHQARLIVDYFSIETQDEIGQIADPNQIANLVFNGPGGTITTCDPNVQPLLNRVTFNAGCTVGMGAVGTFSSIRTVVGNGPGQSTTGYDVQARYSMPFWNGDLTLDFTATIVTELRTGPTSLDGVVISTGDDRLGFLNYQTVAAAAPDTRINFAANYALERQNFRLGMNYISNVVDERPNIQYNPFGDDLFTFDFTYRVELDNDVAVTATVANIFDRDPPGAQEELGYDPRIGNPLGRTFEIGIRKSF